MNPSLKIEAMMEASQTESHPIVELDLGRQRVHPRKDSTVSDPALTRPIASIHQNLKTPYPAIQSRAGKELDSEPQCLQLACQADQEHRLETEFHQNPDLVHLCDANEHD